MSYITLTADDPEFLSYLMGSFSPRFRALPVESFSQHSGRARVTFRVVPVVEIKRPAWWKIYFRGCRPELLGLTIGPLLVTVLWMLMSGHAIVDPVAIVGAAFGLFFLHVAAFLFNDFRDHMRGVDFANRRRGSQVIQKGWASAQQVKRWAFMNAGLAFLFGMPALFRHGLTIPAIVLAAIICVLGLTWMPPRLVRAGASDALVFLGLGPMLSAAASTVAFGIVPPQILWLGFALGAMAVLTLQIRQLENLFRAGQESFRTFIGAFDFDRAKKLVFVMTVAVAAIQFAAVPSVDHRWAWYVGLSIAMIPSGLTLRRVQRAASPLSSDLVHLGRRAVWAQACLLAWWGAAIWVA